jgi:hypothetical protein
MLRVTGGVDPVLPRTNKHPLMPLDELGLVESQLDRPRHGVDWRPFHVSYLPFVAALATRRLRHLARLFAEPVLERWTGEDGVLMWEQRAAFVQAGFVRVADPFDP